MGNGELSWAKKHTFVIARDSEAISKVQNSLLFKITRHEYEYEYDLVMVFWGILRVKKPGFWKRLNTNNLTISF